MPLLLQQASPDTYRILGLKTEKKNCPDLMASHPTKTLDGVETPPKDTK